MTTKGDVVVDCRLATPKLKDLPMTLFQFYIFHLLSLTPYVMGLVIVKTLVWIFHLISLGFIISRRKYFHFHLLKIVYLIVPLWP